jgi:hypothetical protein
MSAPIRYQSISAIGDFTALTASDEDYLAIDPARCAGGGGPPQRTTIEPAPGEDGALIFPPFDDAWIVTIAGDLFVTSTGHSSEAGYFAAVDTLLASLKSALDSLKTTPGSLTHSGGTESVWLNAALDPTWQDFFMCSVTFGLVVDVL